MANTICASSNISLCPAPTKPTLKTPYSPSTLTSSLSLNVAFDESLAAVAVAHAAVQAARDAVTFARALKEISFGENEFCENDDESVVSEMRRKKRRKRRKGFSESSNVENGIGRDDSMEVQLLFCSSSRRSVFLTPKEEAEFTQYLKEGAKIEAGRRNMLEMGECEPTSTQWAESIGIKRSKVERTLCIARESRERIIHSYRRLVMSIANAYQNKGLSLQDLVQEGRIGLLKGAERFDPKKGYKLSTYIYWWIKQAMIRAIANKSRVIRLPGSMSDMLPKVAEANTVLRRRLRRQPTFEEIATMVGVPGPSVKLLLERNRPVISLDQDPTDHGSMALQDIMAGPDELSPETMMKQKEMKQEVEGLLKTLDEREAIILRLHYGLSGETPYSFDEIGRQLKLSRERVRQINWIALTKLREIDNIDNLRVYMM